MNTRFTSLLLLWVIFCAGCTRHQDYPEAIQRAESCMNAHPDSALHYLSAYADSIGTQPEETRMYYHLLTHQAKDKLYIKPESDSLINRIVAFYDETDDKDKQMLAYYYQGSAYRDMNDAPRALKAFQQVLDLGEGYPPCDLFARTYNQMGTLFAYQGLYDESLEANKKAAEQFILQGKKNRTSYALRDIARMYDAKNQMDSALHYYQESCETALSDSNHHRYHTILGEFGAIYHHINKEKGKQMLLTAFNYNPKAVNVNLIIGTVYEEENKLDSAKYYYLRALQYGDLHKQYHAHHHLFQVLMKQNKPQKAMEHYHAANALDDSIKRTTATEAVAKMNALHDYQRSEQANIQLQLTKRRQAEIIWALSFFLLLAVSIAATIYLHIQKKHQAALAKEQTLLKQAKYNYENSLKRAKENQKKSEKLITLLEENKKQYSQLEQELSIAKKDLLEKQNALILASNKEKELLAQVFMESDIYSLFHQAAYKSSINLSAKEWSSLKHQLHEAYPNFLPQLKELYPNPSEHELRICLLLKIKISLTGIANLLNCSQSSITNARTRLYERFFGKKGKASELDKFIAEL